MKHDQLCPLCRCPFGKHTREQMSECVLELAMDLSQAKDALAAARAEEREAHRVTDAFAVLVMDKMDEYEFSLDGADIQELAVESGILTETKYNPEIHGDNADVDPGDPWYVFSEAFKAIRARRTP